MNTTPRPPFQWRALTSVLIAGAFLILALSGALLFLSPPGRVANWTDWRLVGLTKQDWTALHITFSALFLAAAALHLLFNWRPMLNYFRDRVTRRLGLRREWAAALAVCLVAYFGARHEWPPFRQLLAWNESLKNSWDNPVTRAPIPHAELLTLEELCRQAQVDLATATDRLRQAGATQFTPETQVRQIAADMALPAQRVYEILTTDAATAGTPHNADRPGGGPGWMTLQDYCAQQHIPIPAALQHLEAKGYRAQATQTLREIAVENGLNRPFELIETLRSVPQAAQ